MTTDNKLDLSRSSGCAALRGAQISEQPGPLFHQLQAILRCQQQLRRAARAELAIVGIAGAYRILGRATHYEAQKQLACAPLPFSR